MLMLFHSLILIGLPQYGYLGLLMNGASIEWWSDLRFHVLDADVQILSYQQTT